MVVVVMGVSGAGKTTVGTLLASGLRWRFVDADDFHPDVNIRKLVAGTPLTDEDRAPWLAALRCEVERWLARGESVVLACSALKQAYRDVLARPGDDVRWVYLKVPAEVVAPRLASRRGHFASADILESQFHALEEPADAVVVDGTLPPREVAARARQALGLTSERGP
ncbi:MAG: gluconokinase, GntK/IdnK-type [Myxococcota bacterium]